MLPEEAAEVRMAEETKRLVDQFWQAMNTNDWQAASLLLHEEYVLEYPQSGERIRGRAPFVAINANYPAAGPWRFSVHRIVADERGAVSDVTVTAPAVTARVVSFFEMRDGTIWRMREFWPDPFEAAAWREQWVERIESDPNVSEP
jgi:ketosteroid isomerase-like protein